MPVEEISNYNGVAALKSFVAEVEAAGGTVKQFDSHAGGWTVLYETRKKPGPKPRETR